MKKTVNIRIVLCAAALSLAALLAATTACDDSGSREESSSVEENTGTGGGTVENAGVAGGGTAVSSASYSNAGAFGLEGPGYITFVINVHDTVHVDESADTILRLIGIYEKYGVRGDFYLTAPIVKAYSESRPDVIERLQSSNMTISYHVRAPHPLHSGFDKSLRGLDGAALASTLRDYETYALDPATGDLFKDQPGGYTYVAQVFGRSPVSAPTPNKDPQIKAAAEKIYASLGAQMTLLYHEEGTDLNKPFVWVNGLLVRPSDFSITRWTLPGSQKVAHDEEPFWWNMLNTPEAGSYNPSAYLQQRLAEWSGSGADRPPIITSLIHENNFSRSGPEGWSGRYFTGGDESRPLEPPFDLFAPDSSTLRSDAGQEAIWSAYEQMVAWASQNLMVVTSQDIVELAKP